VLELLEKPLDEIALAIECGINGTLHLAIPLGRDMRPAAVLVDEIDDGAGIVTTIGNDITVRLQSLQQRRDGSFAGRLALREHDPHWHPPGD